ncbi:MAG TPA: hypothetical protein VGJ90_11630 [Methylophilaceae bacterium]|jgi:hypothetical protein
MVKLLGLNYTQALSVALLGVLGFASSNVMAATVEEKIEILQQEIESLKDQLATAPSGNRAKGIQSLADRTTVGGYGNVNYNSYSGGATVKDKIDVQRFVLFFGHRFNDMISLKTEFEVEHAISSADDQGEAEVEQMYLDFHFNDKANAKVGLFLIPAGFINETHEPPTFYGVERNQIESRIIPTTWREAGVSVYGEAVQGLKYQVGVTTGFSAAKFDDALYGIKSAHQEGQLADAEDLALSAALNYSGVPGLLVGGSVFTGNTGQGNPDIGNARLTLWDLHTRYQTGSWDLRALYARGHLGDAANIKTVTGFDAPSSFYGWFTEAAYHVWKSGDMDFAPFIRYESYDTQASLPNGSVRLPGSRNKVWTAGASFWPDPKVVLKADYQVFDKQDIDAGGNSLGDKRINLGMGYMF